MNEGNWTWSRVQGGCGVQWLERKPGRGELGSLTAEYTMCTWVQVQNGSVSSPFGFLFFLSLWSSEKQPKQSPLFFFFKILLCPLIHHYDTLVLEIITKCQLNVYPMDKCWNIYLQIDAFYKEALRFIWKNELLRSWVCHLQRYLVWYQVIHLNLSACLFLYRIVKVRIESIRNGFRTFLEHFSRHLNWN